ncbi:molybdenum cofactor biosynthesis protein MoeB [Adhaeribacter aerolatus]|uniref:Molybdopterin-synthase adenylyltransferase n=1 Tax=Adhaeribacter aerolatus TaxID=670289 RepID=A0A512AZD8_9BACT|nr:molybdopterin-synthase adenylyltransferase MoeB [Adhaeribacter aerolatus]GEO05066.1 molybdenum cofactor biosynthesis protein MoeB [Adhaeribacter aerolatus]
MLQKEELKRYNRHLILPEIGYAGQEKLKAAKVLVIGAGGLGCPVLQYLAAAGVGTLGVVDDDVVDYSNLQRQILFSTADAGRKKAEVAAEKLAALNPFVSFQVQPVRLTPDNAAALFQPYDLIVDGSDNFPTRYLVNDTCVALNKPLVFGSVFKFDGQVAVFNYQGGPTYRCLYPTPPAADESPNCADIGVVGVLPGLIGLYMANEVIKLICGIGTPLSGKLLLLDALEARTSIFTVRRSAAADQPLPQTAAPESCQVTKPPVAQVSLMELTEWLEQEEDQPYLVDVREPQEFTSYNLGGVNIPFADLPEQLTQLPADKTIVFCCGTGQRSLAAATLVQEAGFTGEVYNLRGGVLGN